MKKDYLGNSIDVGDRVVFVLNGYRCFAKGIITKMTEKTCLIKQERVEEYKGQRPDFKQFHDQVVKIPHDIQKTEN